MEEKKKSKLIPIVLVIVGILLIGGGLTLTILNKDNKDKKDDNKDQTQTQTDRADDREVDEKLLKELVKIAFIDDEETSKYSPLDGIDGFISDAEISKQLEIIVNYANNNEMLKSADASNCPAGEGDCKSISNDIINKVAALYTIQPESILNSQLVKKSDDGNTFYVRFKNNTASSDENGMHSYFSMKMDDEIIISDSMHIMNIGDNGDVISNKMINKEYMFRKNEGSEEYSLYAVRDHSIVEDMPSETGRDVVDTSTMPSETDTIPASERTDGTTTDTDGYPDGTVPGTDGTSTYNPDVDSAKDR